MKLRKFSQKTIKSYLYYITEILNFASKNPVTTHHLQQLSPVFTLILAQNVLKLRYEQRNNHN
jgi:hypothetical protein